MQSMLLEWQQGGRPQRPAWWPGAPAPRRSRAKARRHGTLALALQPCRQQRARLPSDQVRACQRAAHVHACAHVRAAQHVHARSSAHTGQLAHWHPVQARGARACIRAQGRGRGCCIRAHKSVRSARTPKLARSHCSPHIPTPVLCRRDMANIFELEPPPMTLTQPSPASEQQLRRQQAARRARDRGANLAEGACSLRPAPCVFVALAHESLTLCSPLLPRAQAACLRYSHLHLPSAAAPSVHAAACSISRCWLQ